MIREKCLVLYKNHPALVDGIDDKISIRIRGGEKSRVREKDIEFLHPGPVSDLSGFSDQIPEGDLEGAWALLEGSTSNLQELSELVFGGWSPQNAWQAWLLLKDGLYFSGTINSIQACNKDDIEKEKEKRGGKAKEAQDREAFLERLRKNSLDLSDDARRLQDVEALALGKSEKSRTLKDLGKEESPIQAHKVLLSSGFWTTSNNPYPSRFGLSLSSAKEPIAAPPDEDRLDLTGLRSFAIDNAWSGDPDDAISLDGNTLYVHVSDPAASILSDSPADLEARGRGETLYLPEACYRMLAEESLPLFALGLSDVSPALTFRLNLDDKAEIVDVEILRSLVHVERLSYAEADEKAAEEELSPLFALADKLLAKRLASGAVSIDLPETHISVLDGKISIEAVQVYRSSEMVREFMLVAGVAASRWAMRKRVPFPFVAQELGDLPSQSLEGYAGSYQLRRCMRPRRLSSQPGRHGGLGLEEYTQVTSPLRRYTDLLAHQQIRAFLKGGPLLSTDEVLLRVAAGEIAAQASVQAERASRSHWTMVYLSEHKNSEWDAVVVERKGNRATVLIPSLGLETQLTVKGDPALNEGIRLSLNSVRIPELLVTFSSI